MPGYRIDVYSSDETPGLILYNVYKDPGATDSGYDWSKLKVNLWPFAMAVGAVALVYAFGTGGGMKRKT